MALFWIIAAVMALGVALLTARALLSRARPQVAGAEEVALYKAQLREIERDLARGLIPPEEAERSRAEVGRRLLAADGAAPATQVDPPRGLSRAMALGTLGLVAGGGLLLYVLIGAPGYTDQPLAERLANSEALYDARPSQEEVEAAVTAQLSTLPPADVPESYRETVAQLREIAPERPDDLTAWELLARHEAVLGNYAAAADAQGRVIGLKGEDATVEDLVALLDLRVAAAAGLITPETETLALGILDRDEGNLAARYYLGLMYAQVDRADLAFRLWRVVVENGAPGDMHAGLARGQIEDIAFAAGLTYSLPPERGPSAEDIAAAGDMEEADRMAMIEGMVAGLADRLATEGGPPADWARLITSLGVLGETERAAAIWEEAQVVFAGSDAALATLRGAAQDAGVLE